MKVKIDASKDFYKFLIKNYGDDFSLINKKEVVDDGELNSALGAMAGTIIMSFLVNIASSFVHDAIREYYKKHLEPIKISTNNGIKVITPENVDDEEIKEFLEKKQ